MRGAGDDDAGEVLAAHLVKMMAATGIPDGLAGVGYGAADVEALVAGTAVQTRLLDNAPRPVTREDLGAIFTRRCRTEVPRERARRPAGDRAPAIPHFLVVPTRWMDNDVYGHVNNVVYYSYFDTVINRYLIAEGGLDIAAGDVIGVAAESHCRYRRAVSFPADLDAGLRVGKLGRSSVRYEIGIFGPGDDLAAAEGWFVHVFVDRVTRLPTTLPDRVRAALERLVVP